LLSCTSTHIPGWSFEKNLQPSLVQFEYNCHLIFRYTALLWSHFFISLYGRIGVSPFIFGNFSDTPIQRDSLIILCRRNDS
jgi:hypothetical protein